MAGFLEGDSIVSKVINTIVFFIGLALKHKKVTFVFFVVFTVVALVGGRKFWHYAESSEFCGGCHEMDVHYDSFMSSKHHNEHVHACHTCHIAPGLKGFLHAKLSDGRHDSQEHFKGTFLTTANSGLFIDIAEDSIPIVNGNCVSCHLEKYTQDKTHIEKVTQSKKQGEDGGIVDIYCTDCHLGLVHPHMKADVFKAFIEKKMPPIGVYEQEDCFACHRHATPKVVKEWTNSKHASGGVTCIECHGDDHSQIVERGGMVLPSKCGECHVTMYTDFAQSNHYKGRVVAKFDGVVSSTKDAIMREDCKKCHVLGLNKSWDAGPGGSCEGCHSHHLFSREKAAEAETCKQCRIGGPDHAQLDMSSKSVHGKLYSRWEREGKIKVTCQTCHSDPYNHHNFNRNVALRD